MMLSAVASSCVASFTGERFAPGCLRVFCWGRAVFSGFHANILLRPSGERKGQALNDTKRGPNPTVMPPNLSFPGDLISDFRRRSFIHSEPGFQSLNPGSAHRQYGILFVPQMDQVVSASIVL